MAVIPCSSPPTTTGPHPGPRAVAAISRRLERLRRPAFTLLKRLERTAEYKLAVQLSDEDREDEGNLLPAYVLAAALEGNLLLDLDEICDYLRDAARDGWPRRKRVLRK